ncbi:hypothetical protein DOY81_008978 [Sarcophaga bullata]|nr:hypothetical protein DOY81_008978 [Sarcophaga bullata]
MDTYSSFTFSPVKFINCNHKLNCDGWIAIQRRINGKVDFYRNWSEYKTGFGDIHGEFFIGLDKLHTLTSTLEPVELLIHGNYVGNAGDSFSQHVGYGFTTKDRDNDIYAYVNCAILFTAAWCNLNGKYYQHPTKYYNATVNNGGINWGTFRGYGYSLKSVQMLIRPRQV